MKYRIKETMVSNPENGNFGILLNIGGRQYLKATDRNGKSAWVIFGNNKPNVEGTSL